MVLCFNFIADKNRRFPGLTGNAWTELKSDIFIGFDVSDSLYRSNLSRCCYASLAIIAIYQLNPGFPDTTGHPALSKPGPIFWKVGVHKVKR